MSLATRPTHDRRANAGGQGPAIAALMPALRRVAARGVVHALSALAAAGVMMPLTGAAQERGVLGQGNVACATWMEERSSDTSQSMARVAWVLGYITAFNEYGVKSDGDVNLVGGTEQIIASIDDHCRQNPGQNIYGASSALVEAFKRNRTAK